MLGTSLHIAPDVQATTNVVVREVDTWFNFYSHDWGGRKEREGEGGRRGWGGGNQL